MTTACLQSLIFLYPAFSCFEIDFFILLGEGGHCSWPEGWLLESNGMCSSSVHTDRPILLFSGQCDGSACIWYLLYTWRRSHGALPQHGLQWTHPDLHSQGISIKPLMPWQSVSMHVAISMSCSISRMRVPSKWSRRLVTCLSSWAANKARALAGVTCGPWLQSREVGALPPRGLHNEAPVASALPWYLFIRASCHSPHAATYLVICVISGDRIGEAYNKSPDLASWGAPVLLKAEIPLRSQEGQHLLRVNYDHS